MNIAIIPARGGSKRIPRKNIKMFHGKPMIAYSIDAAKRAGCFDKIIVSTDDQEIADISRKYGAEVPFIRPAEIANDFATTMDVMAHGVNWCIKNGMEIENVCCIYATAPFISEEYILKGLDLMSDKKIHYAFSATTFAFPIQRALIVDETGQVKMFQPEHATTRSQDLPEAYHDAGQFYWGRPHSFRDKKTVFSNSSKIVTLPRVLVQDIDTVEDWEFAKVLFSVLGTNI